jgi:uncharacterized RmlC-like cupin family protein
MHYRIYIDEDDNYVQEFDEAGIDWFIEGLEKLREVDPGDALVTPAVPVPEANENGRLPEPASELVFVKVEATEPESD